MMSCKNYDVMESFSKSGRFKGVKIFHFTDINKIFANITKKIYFDVNEKNLLRREQKNIFIWKPFVKLSVNIAKHC